MNPSTADPWEAENLSRSLTFFEHFDELRKRAIRAAAAVGIATGVAFSMGMREAVIMGVPIIYPFPDVFHNISSMIFDAFRNELLPPYVEVIVTAPAQALFSLVYISLFLGVLISMPVIVQQTLKFVSPGLYPHEKKLIAKFIVPATGLFIGGAVFTYYTLIPFTLNFLYQYAITFEARTFITIESFISFVLMFMIGMGIGFQLPLIMIGLTSLGVVDKNFWKTNFRYAFIALAIFGAIITPDGSGITMWLVALPMLALYGAGYFFARKYARQGEGFLSPPAGT